MRVPRTWPEQPPGTHIAPNSPCPAPRAGWEQVE